MLKAHSIVKCLHCGDQIQSKSRWDMFYCTCGSIAVDGGISYCKISHETNAQFIFVNCEEDSQKPLVGPRDTSQDKAWCCICDKLVFKTGTVKGYMPARWDKGKEYLTYACKACLVKGQSTTIDSRIAQFVLNKKGKENG